LSPTNLIALHVLNGFRREHRKASAHEITFFRICAFSSPTTRKTAIRVRLSNGSVSVTRPKSSVSFRKARAHRSVPFKTGDSGNNNDFAIVQYGASCGLFTIAHKATAQGISKGEMMSLNKSVQRSASFNCGEENRWRKSAAKASNRLDGLFRSCFSWSPMQNAVQGTASRRESSIWRLQ
jgi:hypothetical protein